MSPLAEGGGGTCIPYTIIKVTSDVGRINHDSAKILFFTLFSLSGITPLLKVT